MGDLVIKWYPYSIPVITTKMPKDEFGEFLFFPNPKILVSEDIQGSILSSTLLHEILEMVNEVHDLGLTESKIRTLEISLSQIMGENPDLCVFPKKPPECPQGDSGDEDGSRLPLTPRSDPEAS